VSYTHCTKRTLRNPVRIRLKTVQAPNLATVRYGFLEQFKVVIRIETAILNAVLLLLGIASL